MAFLKHQKVHANDSPYKCSYPGCKKTFKTLSDFRAHKRVAHKPRGLKFSGHKCVKSSADYYCTKCNKRFKSVGSLKTHMISHMNLPALPPNSVKKDTIEASGVPESVAKGVFTCRICSTPHVTWTEFSKHFQKVHGSVPKILIQYKCVPCDLLFQNKQVYLDHNRKSHTPKNQVQTFPPISNESKQIYTAPKNHEQNKILLLSAPSPNFSSNGPLVKIVTPNNTSSELSPAPLTTPTSTAEKKHICPICSRGFKRSDNLKAHARTVHYGLKANNCNACGKGYRTKNELLRHQSKACPFRELQSHDFKLDFDESLLNF